MAFDGALKHEYLRVNPLLYNAVVTGIVAAANAFNPNHNYVEKRPA